jgi:NAD(P)-dependent dehydrogenase (short-subunit alcohol dehydrogenase family)
MSVAFAKEGMNIVVASLHEDKADTTAELVREIGTEALVVQTEAPDPDAMERLVQLAYQEFSEVNVLVLNVGGQYPKPVLELSRDDWDRVFNIEVGGVLTGILAFLPHLLAQGGERHIINMASMAALGKAELRQTTAAYVAANSAVLRMTEAMAPALAAEGIDMSVVCPGMTKSDASRVLNPNEVAQQVLRAIRNKELYVFPDQTGRSEVEDRHRMLMAAFDRAAVPVF